MKGVKLPDLTPEGVEQLELLPPDLKEIADTIGEDRARRVWALMERGIVASLPELCAYDWLEQNNVKFEFQSVQQGGKLVSGGSVVDFIIYIGTGVYIWRVMGEYWHSGQEQQTRDLMQKIRLKNTRIGSFEVIDVVDLWELDIYNRHPEVFEMAMFGVGLRG
jgi:hypothetical protein